MLKTKQDLMNWFNDLVNHAIKQSILTAMVNGEKINVETDKQNALLVLDIIQKYEREIAAIPTKEQLKIFEEIAEQCASNSFRSINVTTKKRQDAIMAIWEYIKNNF